jgi:polyphosphate kinase
MLPEKDNKKKEFEEENSVPTVYPILSRDISWLSFNYRVLQEAKDERVPLMERIKFLGIYSSNLDEFFRVRVASLQSILKLGKKTQKRMDFAPEETLQQIRAIVRKQQLDFSEIYQKQILPALKAQGIHVMRRQDLSAEHLLELNRYVEEVLIQHVQPILMVKGKIRTFLRNNALYLAVILETAGQSNRYALVRIPTDQLPRFVELRSSDKANRYIILLDDIVRHALPSLFPGYTVQGGYSIKMTRDAELHIEDEYVGNLIDKIKRGLAKRNIGGGTRFVYDRKMPRTCLDFVMENFNLEEHDLHPEGRYHNNFDFFKFPTFGRAQLKDPLLPPLPQPNMEGNQSLFQVIADEDQLLHFPYQRYDYVLRFLEQAAQDPSVVRIKITQYRVAKDSQILSALWRALQAGKEVTVFVEVKARFDEEANLSWAEKLEEWGAKVLYSLPEIKVHAKLAMVSRIEGKKEQNYCYLSTGNFNENTALLYTDYGYFTSDERITSEVGHIFDYLESDGKKEHKYKHLLVGQNRLRLELFRLIDQEAKNARAGKPASIEIKANSVQDRRTIEKLYDAGKAGVKIRMVVRGLCCIIPQVEGLSENIEIISIVDRFLEHTRMFAFLNHGGEKLIYLSSADLMTRNLYHRIECAFPIFMPALREQIMHEFELQWQDNQKARIIDAGQSNQYAQPASADAPIVRSQTDLYTYYQQIAAKK